LIIGDILVTWWFIYCHWSLLVFIDYHSFSLWFIYCHWSLLVFIDYHSFSFLFVLVSRTCFLTIDWSSMIDLNVQCPPLYVQNNQNYKKFSKLQKVASAYTLVMTFWKLWHSKVRHKWQCSVACENIYLLIFF